MYYLTDEKGKELTSEIQKEQLECKDDLRNGKYTKFNLNGSKAEDATFIDHIVNRANNFRNFDDYEALLNLDDNIVQSVP